MAIQLKESLDMEKNKKEPSSRRLNSLLSMWYGVIIGSLQIYIIVQNVWKFVRFAEMPWPSTMTPTIEMNVFIGLNGLAVLLLPFFIASCFLKIGNMANDNQMLGKRLKCREDWTTVFPTELQDNKNIFSSIWTHCGPISSLLHIICAVCLLFPQIIMESVLIKNGFIAKEYIWKSDLDFISNEEPEDMIVRPIGSSVTVVSDFNKKMFSIPSKHDGLKLEFMNYALGLFCFSIRYAQVFWSSHKKFAIIFGIQQLLNSVHSLVSFCTLTILYKVHVSSVYQESTPFLLNSQVTLLIFGISLTVLFFSSSILYYLGYLKFASFLQEKVRKQYVTESAETSFYGSGWIYFPHSAAVSAALALAAAQSPLVHDAFIVYQVSSRAFLMAFPISSVTHFLLWALLWLCITLTKSWTFDVQATIVKPVEGPGSAGVTAEITIDLSESIPNRPFSPPLVVISEGKAFSVCSIEDQKCIRALLPVEQRDEPTYWRKATTTTPTPSCLSYKSKSDHSKVKYMSCRKEVTFDDELHSPRYYSRPQSRVEKYDWRNESSNMCCPETHHDEEFDAGEYAYLAGSKSIQVPKHGSQQAVSEKIYGQLQMNQVCFSERNAVSSPLSTADSSSGVSSLSTKSNMGPPSTSASCSQYSEGIVQSDQDSIAEPTAHYEPVRVLSRRNSMRSYVGHDSPQRLTAEELYGKITGVRPSPRTESIYSMGKSKLICDSRFNRSVYEKSPRESESRFNYASESRKFTEEITKDNSLIVDSSKSNCSNNSKNNPKIYDYLDSFNPPIPPPLPILSCVMNRSSIAVVHSSN